MSRTSPPAIYESFVLLWASPSLSAACLRSDCIDFANAALSKLLRRMGSPTIAKLLTICVSADMAWLGGTVDRPAYPIQRFPHTQTHSRISYVHPSLRLPSGIWLYMCEKVAVGLGGSPERSSARPILRTISRATHSRINSFQSGTCDDPRIVTSGSNRRVSQLVNRMLDICVTTII
eukprot:3993769-Pyramimonas_sp.AAC.1